MPFIEIGSTQVAFMAIARYLADSTVIWPPIP